MVLRLIPGNLPLTFAYNSSAVGWLSTFLNSSKTTILCTVVRLATFFMLSLFITQSIIDNSLPDFFVNLQELTKNISHF